ncbi:hypothetical protein GALMADRAFT_249900 [Galerina marginata CBS 339.88]|uniref:Zn(2)-C6 fungal-type domain-containing protein n=1 Tax=Galerina marginata (strain CBS 339.88) TaxID=685588 RepID=A0A067SY60_GALM3|nr:hypothetical protein GALMADRAFT_249900 [Galerina marginata CBS 339.88]
MASQSTSYQQAQQREGPSQLPAAGSSNEPPRDSLSIKTRPPTKATRRIRGEIACAECRRLKIRCDRTVPCSTCVKRGCGALCPNGTIPPGEGSRFVLAATDHLHHKMTKMEARMRSLEDALAIIHTSESDRPHPLLSSKDEFDDEEEEPTLQAVSQDSPQSPLSPPLGTLWMDGQGGSRFFGPSGGSESLLMSSSGSKARKASPVLQELDPSYLAPEINQCYQSFPFTPPNIIASSVQPMIESFLPSIDRAITLCDTFLEHLSWMFHIVSRHKLVNELIPILYKQVNTPYGPHDLALLLVVLGIGSLVDLNLPPYNLEAQHYYRLARATLALQPVLGAQSMVTIKVLHLMSVYNGMSGKESNLDQSYILLDLAGQVALRIGFHVDPSMWGFEGREAYDRRVYFWNLMAGVLWQSLVTGRPPSLLMSYIDCRLPSVEDENLYQEGEVPLGFGIWGFKASQECLIPLVRLALAAKPPSYESVVELDRKIRDLALPKADASQSRTDRTAISMRIFVRSHYQDLMLMFLHRAHFAQAMTEYPNNPLHSPYSQSVSAAYSSACSVLQDTRAQFIKKPLLCARIWRMWSLAFSAAVIVGTLAIRGIHLNLKPPPLEEFEAIFKVFTSAAETSNRAARALPVLEAMLQKAHQAHNYYNEQGKLAPSDGQDVDELLYFGGQTNFIQEQPAERTRPPHAPPFYHGRSHEQSMSPPPRIAHQSGAGLSRRPTSPMAYPPTPRPSSAVPQPQGPHPRHGMQHQHQQASSSSSRTPPPMGLPMPSPQYQTFADLSGGWNGLFHEVPEPSYGLQRSSAGLSSNANANASSSNSGARPQRVANLAGAGQHQQPQRQNRQTVAPVPGEGQMLDDRWASFMNYDLLREPMQYCRWH